VAVDTAAVSGVAVDTATGEDMKAATSTVMEAISEMTDTSTIGRMTTTTTVAIATGGMGTATADDANIQAGHLSRLNAAIDARHL